MAVFFALLLVLSNVLSQVVATFLAILELCKTNSVVLEGDDTSGEDVDVRLIRNPEEDLEESYGTN